MKTTSPYIPLLFASALLIAYLGGCAHEPAGVRPAPEIYQEATALAKKGKVDKAAEKFMEVRTYYPGDELARKSLLSTGDLYFDNELYESALQSYQEFRLLYPTDPQAGYALFRIGMSNFKQIDSFDRDQTQTVKAIQSFDNFLSSYPTSPLVKEAKDDLLHARTVLAKHYMYIGKFYLKKKEYVGACKRFEYVKSNFEGIPLEDDLQALITTACTTGPALPKEKSWWKRLFG
jgi:outer membrane protein assembly factor BamD